MPIFQVVSDIHGEFENSSFFARGNINPNADALILAGDITTSRRLELFEDLALPTFYVLGNHEYYFRKFKGTEEFYDASLATINKHVRVLRNTVAYFQGVRVIGSTLWTNFWAPTGIYEAREDQAANCVRNMGDFSVISGLNVNLYLQEHRKALKFIVNQLAEPYAGPTIVLTHHAPSFRSNGGKYKDSKISGGFCSSLDGVIESFQPDFWIHGHTHESANYFIGRTRVITNPRGYFPFDLNPDFDPMLTIKVDTEVSPL